MTKAVLVCVMSAALVLAGCVIQGPVDYSVLDQGSQTGFHDDGLMVRVVRDAEEWQAFWSTHRQGMGDQDPPPTIDFAERFVVAVFLGQRPSNGYEVNVSDARIEDDGYIVRYDTVVPGDRCAVLTVITWPYVIALVERREGVAPVPDVVRDNETVMEC